jgi:serine/threonine protein kinase
VPEPEPDVDAPLLLGRYRPIRVLAHGSLATVYLGRDERLGRNVAMKLMDAGTEIDMVRYDAELRALARLNHHGLVSIVDAGIDFSVPDDPRPFLVMELVNGKTLERNLRERTLRARQIGELAADLAETLEYVHRSGLIHRDVTPANIMIANYGTLSSRERALLTDFGLAVEASALPTAEKVAGTAAYLSPEQARNDTLTPATDIYSLGLVILQCFTNEIAFPGTVIESITARLSSDPYIPDTLPEPWPAMLRGMTNRDPLQRPAAEDVAAAVRQVLRSATGKHKGRRASDRDGEALVNAPVSANPTVATDPPAPGSSISL